MTPRERTAAIEARPVSLRQGSPLYISQRDFTWMLARLKRAEELLREHMRFDQMKEPEADAMWEATTAFLDGAEDESK